MPGGGKTYALVWRAKQALKEGRPVFSNVYIKGTYKFTLDDLITYRFPEGSVVLVDEAGRWFNSRAWKELPEEAFDLFTMHRHMRMDLYIAVQSFARIDKALREVVELTYWSKNHPFLPYHKYEGFYDLEKVGSMRKDYDVTHIIWKNNKLRSLYNTHSMKTQFVYKELVPMVEWLTVSRRKKKLYQVWMQKYRIKKKIKDREKAIQRALDKKLEDWNLEDFDSGKSRMIRKK